MLLLGVVAIFILLIANGSAISEWISSVFSVLSPIIIGLITAYLCNFILKFFETRVFKRLENPKINRILSMILTYLVVIALITAFIFLLVPQFITSCRDLLSRLEGFLSAATTQINNIVHQIVPLLGENFEVWELTEQDIMEWVTNFFNTTEDLIQSITSYITLYAGKLVTVVKNLLIGLFISIYMLFSKEKLLATAKKISTAIFTKAKADSISEICQLANKTFSGFIIGQILDAGFITVVSMIVFSIFQIPYAFLISIIVGVTNVIPFFGPFIGAIPSAFIVFIADPQKALVFIILILVIQQIEGNIIAPKIIGNVTGLSSLGVIVAIVLASGFLGIVGMFIGVPLYAVIVTLFNRLIEKKLATKSLPTSLGNYYSPKSLLTYEDEEEGSKETSLVYGIKKLCSWIKRVVLRIVRSLYALWLKIKRAFRSLKNCRKGKKDQNDDHE